jgi:hypothetical protein
VTGLYLGADALRHAWIAQAVVDEHAIEAATDRCSRCGVPGPCDARRKALAVLMGYGQLPQRRPGATHPEAVGPAGPAPSRRGGPSFSWLAAPAAGGRHRRPDFA